MIKKISYKDLGRNQFGWLDARHHFSFGSYYNPKRMGFGTLRVINDDIIDAGAGFDPHPHDNMEIITYVRSGAITHQDSEGNKGRTGAGDVQVMSAGTGIRHSEFNKENEKTTLYQIWIEPNKRNVKPRWDAHEFPSAPSKDALPLLVSGDGTAPLSIYQDAFIYAGTIEKGNTITQEIKKQAYMLVSEGSVTVERETLNKGDALEIRRQDAIEIQANTEAQVLVIDVPGQ